MRYDLFSSGRLYAALKGAGYPDLPAERTLRDWIRNDSAPEGARQFTAALLGLPTDAPPEWERRFEQVWGLLVLVANQTGVPLERVEAMQRELHALRPSPLPDAPRQTVDRHSRDG